MEEKVFAAMEQKLSQMGENALRAARSLALLSADEKVKVLHSMADAVESATGEVLAANAVDMENARKNNLSSAMQDRLLLDEKRSKACNESYYNTLQNKGSRNEPSCCSDVFHNYDLVSSRVYCK